MGVVRNNGSESWSDAWGWKINQTKLIDHSWEAHFYADFYQHTAFTDSHFSSLASAQNLEMLAPRISRRSLALAPRNALNTVL